MTTRTSPLAARVILYGTLFRVRCTSGSSYLRPMRRLIEKMVFSGLVTACRLATWPTNRSPPLVIATTELVVPRSMPITFAMRSRLLSHVHSFSFVGSSAHFPHRRACTHNRSSPKPCAGKSTLVSALVHLPELLLRQRRVGTVLLFGHMASKLINLLAEVADRTFQVGEGSRHDDWLVHTPHTSTSFNASRLIR